MTTKTELHFDAILAKNMIARELRDRWQDGEDINVNYIVECLKDIEDYIGEANQPNVTDIIESEAYSI